MADSSSSSSPAAKQPPPSIRWGIIGLGDVTRQKSGPPFWKCKGSELVAVMRRTPGKAAEFARQVPGGQCVGYDNLEDFLQHPMDAVYVATRPGTHAELAKACAGKSVYVEKPVGRCAAETGDILQAVGADKLYTAYISRAYERTHAVRRLLQEGAIGDCITKVTYKLRGTGGARDMDGPLPWRLDAEQSGGGLIMDVGCHVLDRIDWLCGPIERVTGTAQRKTPGVGVEEYVALRGRLAPANWTALPASGAPVECEWDFAASDAPMDELTIVGPKGSIRLVAMSASAPVYVLDTAGSIVQTLDDFVQPEHTAQGLIQAVTDHLRGVKTVPYLSRGDNALRTSKVLDTVLSGYYGSREIGYWKDPNSWPAE